MNLKESESRQEEKTKQELLIIRKELRRYIDDNKDVLVNLDLKFEDREVHSNITRILEDFELDDINSLQKAMRRLPAFYVYFANLRRIAKAALFKRTQLFEEWYFNVRDIASKRIKEKEKRFTKDDIESKIYKMYGTKYKELKQKVENAEDGVRALDIVEKALLLKKDLLQSIGKISKEMNFEE